MNPAFYRILFRNMLWTLLLLILTGGAVGATLYAWHVARSPGGSVNLRTISLSSAIATGLLGATFLAFAMNALDRPMLNFLPPWYIRWPLKLNKRILLLLQIVATALAVASALFLAFDFPIPAI
ncbi:MAG: hypothetical protein ACTHN5_05175 [Phycisphaerae bacterium]